MLSPTLQHNSKEGKPLHTKGSNCVLRTVTEVCVVKHSIQHNTNRWGSP